MNQGQLARALVLILSAVALSGCFVLSNAIPKGHVQNADPSVIGDWYGLEADDKEPNGVYIHIQKPKSTGPLRAVWTEDKNVQIYELHTMQIGSRKVFAAKAIYSGDNDRLPQGFFLGFYTQQKDELQFALLQADKVQQLIAAGKVRGQKGPGQYDFLTLTDSSTELAAFLASQDAWAAAMTPWAQLRRAPGKN